MDKRELRAKMRALRRAMPPERAAADSRALAEKLFALPLYRDAKSVYLYLSLPGEVDTSPILERALADGKRVAAPKVRGQDMAFYRLEADTALEVGSFGVREPQGAAIADDETALVIVPGLAFSPLGFRCGYGGGFYDRYLAAHPEHPTVGLCFDFQLTEDLEPEAHDVPVDIVLTP